MTSFDIVLAIAIAAVVVFCVFCFVRQANFDRKAFDECWPPITEEDFLAACPPGIDRAIALRVRAIVAEQLGVEYARLHPAMRFVEDLGS